MKTIKTQWCCHCCEDIQGPVLHLLKRYDGVYLSLCRSCWDYRQQHQGKLPKVSEPILSCIPGRRDTPPTLDLLDQLQDGDIQRFRWASWHKRVLRDG